MPMGDKGFRCARGARGRCPHHRRRRVCRGCTGVVVRHRRGPGTRSPASSPGRGRARTAEAWSEATTQALLGDPALRPTAAELALAYYDSAPCEPLRLVVGKDETSLLTQR